jgi:hypothetical protein
MVAKQRDLIGIVGQRRELPRLVGRLARRFTACDRRLDAVGRRIVRRRPALLAAPIVRRQHAGLSSPLPARLARLGIGTQEVADVDDELVLRGQQ